MPTISKGGFFMNLQDIYNITTSKRYTFEQIGSSWERGYLSHYYFEADPSEFQIREGKGIRAGELFYLWPSSRSVNYHHRIYFIVHDTRTGLPVSYKELSKLAKMKRRIYNVREAMDK